MSQVEEKGCRDILSSTVRLSYALDIRYRVALIRYCTYERRSQNTETLKTLPRCLPTSGSTRTRTDEPTRTIYARCVPSAFCSSSAWCTMHRTGVWGSRCLLASRLPAVADAPIRPPSTCWSRNGWPAADVSRCGWPCQDSERAAHVPWEVLISTSVRSVYAAQAQRARAPAPGADHH